MLPVKSLRAPFSSVSSLHPLYIRPLSLVVGFFLNDAVVLRLFARIMHSSSDNPNYARSRCIIQPTPTPSCEERGQQPVRPQRLKFSSAATDTGTLLTNMLHRAALKNEYVYF